MGGVTLAGLEENCGQNTVTDAGMTKVTAG